MKRALQDLLETQEPPGLVVRLEPEGLKADGVQEARTDPRGSQG